MLHLSLSVLDSLLMALLYYIFIYGIFHTPLIRGYGNDIRVSVAPMGSHILDFVQL